MNKNTKRAMYVCSKIWSKINRHKSRIKDNYAYSNFFHDGFLFEPLKCSIESQANTLQTINSNAYMERKKKDLDEENAFNSNKDINGSCCFFSVFVICSPLPSIFDRIVCVQYNILEKTKSSSPYFEHTVNFLNYSEQALYLLTLYLYVNACIERKDKKHTDTHTKRSKKKSFIASAVETMYNVLTPFSLND